MKKITCLLAALLLMCGLSWAQQITWSAANQGYENGQVIESVDFNDYVAGEFFKGTNTSGPKYYTTGSAIRCYGGNYFTITSDYMLTEIVFGFATGEGSNAITSDVGTYEDGTWTGSANEVTFTISGTSGHRRFATFTITYDEGDVPGINANNVEIAYDATEGAIEYTINNGVDGGVLTAATESDWLTIGTVGETVPFTCSVNPDGERMATVVLTYTYDTDQTVIKNVTVTQLTNPNAPGSEANPYTVAQARAAIDAGTGTQGVYATGIVSAIPTAYNSTYGNVTFNMVDEEGDEEFLQAYRCGGDEAANVAIGDVVVVYGNLTKYGSTYEFGQGCQIVTLTHPVIITPVITVTPNVVNVDAAEHDGTLTITYENIPDLISFDYYFCDAEGNEAQEAPDWIDAEIQEENENYSVYYVIDANDGEARTAYFKVYTFVGDELEEVYSIVTVNQEEYVAPSIAELPFSFNGGRDDIEGTDGLTQEGLGSDYNATSNPTTQLKFDGTGDWMLLHFNEAPGTLTFDIKGNSFSGGTFTVQTSEDGETYEDLAAYTELGGAETKTFDNLDENVRYIKWIYTEKSSGNVGLGNIYLYEVGGGPAPEASITVAPATVNVDAEEHDGTLDLAYENLEITSMEDFAIQYYDAEGEEAETPDWIEVLVAEQDPEIGEGYVVSYYMVENEGEARSAYFKVYAMDDETNLVYSNLVTINQAAYVAPVLDYAELPFAFNGGKADIEGTDGLTQEGLGNDYNATSNPTTQLKFDGTGDWMLLHFNEAPGTLTFDIKGNSFNGGTFTVQTSEDGETYEDLVAYTELGDVDTKTFDNLDENVRYIKWVYTEKSQGNVGLGDIHLYEVGGGPAPVPSITFNPDVFDFDAEQHVLQIPFTYENIEVTNYASFTTHFYNAEGEEIQLIPGEAWYYCSVTGINAEGYQLTGVVTANEGEARSAYIKVSALDAAGETVYSNLVTVNQAAYVAPIDEQQFALFGGNLVEGDYIIYYEGKAMNNVVSSGRLQYAEIEPEDNVITTDNTAIIWHIAPNDEGYWTIYSADANAYAASTGVKNKAQMLEDGTDDMAMWTVTEISGTYEFVNKANAAGDINANLRNNGTYGFACYSTSTGGALSLYKLTETVVTYTLEIEGYGDSEGGYYLIASPVLAVTPTIDNGFLTEVPEQYDLYYFDQAGTEGEWINFKTENNVGINFFNIATGKGYLYASQENTTLTFTGIPYEGNGKVALDYVEGVNLTGWNLIGNPFDEDYDISIGNDSDGYAETNFFVMNENGDDFELAERSVVHPMEGVLVEATAAGQFALFSNETGAWGGDPITKLNIRVSDENGKGDFARIRFGEGNNLEKFMLNPANTKLYFPMDDANYAVVYTDNMGEMPLNFSAAADGDYTLSINPENVEMEYLHLIDNVTGIEVDLLETLDYTFEARVNDNANRFKLVFAGLTGMDENNTEHFAFFSNGNFIVSNEGNAMLQVVDVTGRIVKSETINGTASISMNATPGVYMLRLINGNDVKVQKVVVR